MLDPKFATNHRIFFTYTRPSGPQENIERDGAQNALSVGSAILDEAKLSLSASQAPLFARWKDASLDIAKRRETDCASHDRRASMRGQHSSVVDRLTLEEDLPGQAVS